jgi:plastocyanin
MHLARRAAGALLLMLLVAPAAARPAQSANAVTIRDFAFAPQVLTIAAGTTVTWTNADDEPHVVSATDKSFRSPALDGGGSFTFTFAKTGEYAYFCALHPHMTGKIIVR